MSCASVANRFGFRLLLLTAALSGFAAVQTASGQVLDWVLRKQVVNEIDFDGTGVLGSVPVRSGGNLADLPSGDDLPPEASLSDGRLHIHGTSGDDKIEVSLNGASIEVVVSRLNVDATITELLSVSFDANAVDEIRMFGLAGDDLLYNLTSIPDFVWGGIGNDVIRAGSGVSYVFGQAGVDYCFGGDGDDLVSGGDDQDYVAGEDGSDTVYGGFGIDLVTGGYWGGEQEHDHHVDAIYGGPDPDFFVEPAIGYSADMMLDFDNAEDGIY